MILFVPTQPYQTLKYLAMNLFFCIVCSSGHLVLTFFSVFPCSDMLEDGEEEMEMIHLPSIFVLLFLKITWLSIESQ